jgi:hypothetical protein
MHCRMPIVFRKPTNDRTAARVGKARHKAEDRNDRSAGSPCRAAEGRAGQFGEAWGWHDEIASPLRPRASPAPLARKLHRPSWPSHLLTKLIFA